MPRDFPRRTVRGFTLIELVLVIVLLGILAVVAIPRLNTGDFDEYGYTEEAASTLRYAQQIAVARNTSVTAAFGNGAYRICVAATCPSGGDLPNPANGRPWNGTAKGQGQAPAGVTVSATSVTFNGLGRPDDGATIQIGTRKIILQAETGHVRIE